MELVERADYAEAESRITLQQIFLQDLSGGWRPDAH